MNQHYSWEVKRITKSNLPKWLLKWLKLITASGKSFTLSQGALASSPVYPSLPSVYPQVLHSVLPPSLSLVLSPLPWDGHVTNKVQLTRERYLIWLQNEATGIAGLLRLLELNSVESDWQNFAHSSAPLHEAVS